jgi:hypothetical protein
VPVLPMMPIASIAAECGTSDVRARSSSVSGESLRAVRALNFAPVLGGLDALLHRFAVPPRGCFVPDTHDAAGGQTGSSKESHKCRS